MRAPLSIVIPTLNAEEVLAETLSCLIEGLRAGLLRELVVSDGGSTDATVAMAEAAGALIVHGPPGRGGQLARGAAAAGGEWLLFLHADTHLPEGWPDVVSTHIADGDQGRPVAFRLRFRAGGVMPRLVAAGANLRSRLGLPFGDQGLLLPASSYHAAGGHADIALMEDVEFARRLPQRIGLLPLAVTTSAERYLRHGWAAQVIGNLWRQARFLGGADPEELARGYRRRG